MKPRLLIATVHAVGIALICFREMTMVADHTRKTQSWRTPALDAHGHDFPGERVEEIQKERPVATKQEEQASPATKLRHIDGSSGVQSERRTKQAAARQDLEEKENAQSKGVSEDSMRAICKELFMNGMEPLTEQSRRNTEWQANQCNQLFCTESTTGAACEWSKFAVDTLLENTTSTCTDEHIEEFLLRPEWEVYQFSDFLNGVKKRGVGELPQTFPSSIVAEMNPEVTRRTDVEAKRVVANRIAKMPKEDRLQPGTLVIHLRLGDVLEGDLLHSVQDLLHEQKYFYHQATNGTTQQCHPWRQKCMYNLPVEGEENKYVKPLSYYSALEDLDQYKSVIILGAAQTGAYNKRTAVKSCHYTEALKAYLQRRMPGATITLQLGSFPDEDILVAAQASRFIQGGGPFSVRLAKINEHVQKSLAEGKLEPQASALGQPTAVRSKESVSHLKEKKTGHAPMPADILTATQSNCKKLFLNGIEPLSHQSTRTNEWQANDCDSLFCTNSTGNGACQWSEFAIDSLLKSSTSICTEDRMQEFFLKPEWNVYRFSDYLHGYKRYGVAELPQTFPKSLIAEMDPDATKRDFEAYRVVANRVSQMPLKDRLPPGTLVIHLRLGDVLEGDTLHSVQDLLHDQKYYFRQNNITGGQCDPWRPRCMYNPPIKVEGNKYVKPLSHYSSLENLDQFKSVIILGAAHTGNYHRTAVKSCHYTEALKAYLQRRMPRAKIALRLGSFPDEDILVAAQASRFIRGGGGFSLRLAKINEHVQKLLAEGKLDPKESQPTVNIMDKENSHTPTATDLSTTTQDSCKRMFLDGIEPLSNQSRKTIDWQESKCDSLFCTNTTGSCKWSMFAIDTLLENTTRICSEDRMEEFFLKPEWNAYRFSDFLNGVKKRGVGELRQTFPTSLVAEMNPNVTRRTDLEAQRVVANRIAQMPLRDRLQPGTLAIHLRLGDVLEGNILHSVQDLLYEQRYFYRQGTNGTNQQCDPWRTACMYNLPIELEGNKYVKPLSYYSSLEDLDQYKSVVIFGAAHTGTYQRTAVKSCHYTEALKAYFQRRMPHAKITLRLGKFPDEDILVAAQASRFIQGGGGFSLRLGKFNQHVQELLAEGKLEPPTAAPKQQLTTKRTTGGLRASSTRKYTATQPVAVASGRSNGGPRASEAEKKAKKKAKKKKKKHNKNIEIKEE